MKEQVVKVFENGDILVKTEGGGYKYYKQSLKPVKNK